MTYDYDKLRAQFENSPCEKRLRVLRHELITPLNRARGAADWFDMQDLDLSSVEGLPEEFSTFLDMFIRSAREMNVIVFALTDPINKDR
jgi:hypothetical protein